MTSATLAVSAAVISAAYFIGAVTGYGAAILALPVIVWLTGDLNTSVIALLIVGEVQALHVGFFNVRYAPWRELGRMLICAGIGLPIGYACRRYLPQTPLLVAMGLIQLAGGVSGLMPDDHRNPPHWLLKALLVVGGIIHGAFACGGTTLVVYAQHAIKRKEQFRAALLCCWIVLNTILLAWAAVGRTIKAPAMELAGIALPFVLLGGWLGELTARRMGQRVFARTAAALLVAAGLITVGRVL